MATDLNQLKNYPFDGLYSVFNKLHKTSINLRKTIEDGRTKKIRQDAEKRVDAVETVMDDIAILLSDVLDLYEEWTPIAATFNTTQEAMSRARGKSFEATTRKLNAVNKDTPPVPAVDVSERLLNYELTLHDNLQELERKLAFYEHKAQKSREAEKKYNVSLAAIDIYESTTSIIENYTDSL